MGEGSRGGAKVRLGPYCFQRQALAVDDDENVGYLTVGRGRAHSPFGAGDKMRMAGRIAK